MSSAAANGHHDTLTVALAYQAARLSVIPIRRDGSKRPSCASWKPYQQEPADEAQVRRWFCGANPPGVAVIGGEVSGGLECIDFDTDAETTFQDWCGLVEAVAPGLIARLSVARTPKGGYHVRYRCPDMPIPGNAKLAMDPGAKAVLIETRGEGGYALAPGCPAECHPTGRLYEHFSGPPLEQVQPIGMEERDILIRCARSFDHGTATVPPTPKAGHGPGLTAGDDFDQHGPDWPELLEPHGWTAVYHRGGVTYWRRPGKEDRGWSATTGACTSKAGRQLFAVFSSNADPFPGPEGGRVCSVHGKFATYTLLNHGGDFSAAARALAEQGYGDKRSRPSRNGTASKEPGAPPTIDPDAAESPAADANGNVHLTDLGNARRVVKRHGCDLRYIHPWKTWLVWDGWRWAEDQTGEVVRRVKETQGSLFKWAEAKFRELAQQGDDDEDEGRKAKVKQLRSLLAHLLKWEDTRAIVRCLESARSESGIPAVPTQLDADPLLLNVLNGTIDLRTGQLRPHCRADLMTKLAPVEYDAAATCPRWLKFLDRIMAGNTKLIGYLQRVCGYGLTGDVSEQCLWFFHGAGANGKSTFLGILLALLGDYGMQAVSELLMVKHNESHPTERADLFGKRFVATIETEEGKRMAEALMKQMTGGDKIRARKMRQDFFEFPPTHKIILAANHKPQVRGTDHAIWRRIKLVPFTVTIPPREQDKALPAKLKKEQSGILAWLVAGCLDWQRHGLGEPDEVRQATTAYQAEQDVVQGFIDECCQVHPEAKANSSGLLTAYLAWSGDKLMTAPAFRKRMKDKGFESKEGTGGRYFWHGLQLKQATEEGGDSGGEWR
jgi:putative DNA primase/helicase